MNAAMRKNRRTRVTSEWPNCSPGCRATSTRRAKRRTSRATLLLGTIISDVKNRKIELKRDLTDDDVIDVLRKGIKQRRESIEMYDKGGRADLADEGARRSRRRSSSTSRPRSSDDELRAAVRAAIAGGATNDRRRDGQGDAAVQGTRGGRHDQRHRARGAERSRGDGAAGVAHERARARRPRVSARARRSSPSARRRRSARRACARSQPRTDRAWLEARARARRRDARALVSGDEPWHPGADSRSHRPLDAAARRSAACWSGAELLAGGDAAALVAPHARRAARSEARRRSCAPCSRRSSTRSMRAQAHRGCDRARDRRRRHGAGRRVAGAAPHPPRAARARRAS